MPKLTYLIGDATEPILKPAIIAHCCNSVDKWGAGFVLALSKKYPESEQEYHNWFKTSNPKLGNVQFVQVKPDIIVANIIGQEGTRWQGKIPPIRYEALSKGFEELYSKASKENYSVNLPRIGAVLAGGDWFTIENLIKGAMTVDTYVYTLESQKDRWPSVYESLS